MINLSGASMGIGIAVTLADRFSPQAARVRSSMAAMDKQQKALVASNLRAARNIGAVSALLGFGMVRAFGNASKTAAKFEWTMTGVEAILNKTFTSSNQKQKQMAMLTDKAISLSKKYIFSAQEIASAQEYLARAGFGAGDINKTIEAVTALGAATDTQIGGRGGAADMMTNMMTAFHMTADKAQWMADILTRATTSANLEIKDLHESMKYMGSAAKSLNLPFEQAAAFSAVLANAGIRSGISGRGMSQLLVQLGKAAGTFRTPKQANLLKSMGLHPDALKKVLDDPKHGVLPALALISSHIDKIGKKSPSDRISMLSGIFNTRGQRTLDPILNAFTEKTGIGSSLLKLLDTMNKEGIDSMNGMGASTKITEIRMRTMEGTMRVLKDTWISFKIAVGNALNPILKPLVKIFISITSIAEKFSKTNMGQGFMIIAATIAGVVTVAGAYVAILATIRLGQMATGVTGSSMLRTLTGQWNTATAAAARYQAVTGASWTSASGALYTIRGKKGIQRAPLARAGLGSRAGAGLMSVMGSLASGFGRVVSLLFGFAGVLGIVIGVLSIFIGWKKTSSLLEEAFNRLRIGIFQITSGIQAFLNITKGRESWDEGWANHNKRVRKEYLSYYNMTPEDYEARMKAWGGVASRGVASNINKYYQGWGGVYDKTDSGSIAPSQSSSFINRAAPGFRASDNNNQVIVNVKIGDEIIETIIGNALSGKAEVELVNIKGN